MLVGQLGAHRQARALLRAALRPRRASATRRPRRRCASEILADLDEVDVARPRPHPAQPARADRRDAAHQRLQAASRDAIAFKLRSADVPAIPQPAPLFEIYVYSPAMEGIHLRGGAIARGGIRWSDRMDYRTEVYGLMRAQLTKNAVIVPAGRQGRLLPQAPPADRDELEAEVERQYVRLHRARCSTLTDNLVDGEVVHPSGVRVLDERRHLPGGRRRQGHGDVLGHRQPRSPRSTASGSTTRSPPAARPATTTRRSGSPRAARGSRSSATSASSSVDPAQRRVHGRRHRRHVAATCSATGCCCRTRSGSSPPTTTGTSSSTRTRTRRPSFAERKRLFELAGSSWDDYDRAQDLRGRRRVAAHAPSAIPLSPQARAALGDRGRARCAPTEVIRAILRAPVDLLWNGGIGTVVKASTETRRRRAGPRLGRDPRRRRRAARRVVGEGGNLGLTRRARVEYSRAAAGASTPTSSTTRPASTAPTTRST